MKEPKNYTFTRGQLTVVVALLAAAVLLMPTTVSAAGTSFVKIRDYKSNAKSGQAEVNDNKLSVGDGSGPLTVDSKLIPFAGECDANGSPGANCSIIVPAGKTLVVETVSTVIDLPSGQRASVRVSTTTNEGVYDFWQPLVYMRTYAGNTIDEYGGTFAQTFYVTSGNLGVVANWNSGSGSLTVQVTGYLQ